MQTITKKIRHCRQKCKSQTKTHLCSGNSRSHTHKQILLSLTKSYEYVILTKSFSSFLYDANFSLFSLILLSSSCWCLSNSVSNLSTLHISSSTALFPFSAAAISFSSLILLAAFSVCSSTFLLHFLSFTNFSCFACISCFLSFSFCSFFSFVSLMRRNLFSSSSREAMTILLFEGNHVNLWRKSRQSGKDEMYITNWLCTKVTHCKRSNTE